MHGNSSMSKASIVLVDPCMEIAVMHGNSSVSKASIVLVDPCMEIAVWARLELLSLIHAWK